MEFNRTLRKILLKNSFCFFNQRAFYCGGIFLEETDFTVEKKLKGKEAEAYLRKVFKEYYNLLTADYIRNL
jgi:hypothetical protein